MSIMFETVEFITGYDFRHDAAQIAWLNGGMRLCMSLLACLFVVAACLPRADPEPSAPVLPPAAVGIDLSHHNGAVNWNALDEEAVDFIYLKATEGRDWTDPDFQDHWIEATRRGYTVGAYHFYILCKPWEAQAVNFIRAVEVRSGTLPPALDLEYAHNCDPFRDEAGTKAEVQAFLDRLEAEYGAVPVLYTTKEFHADWIAGSFDRYPLWIRSIDGPPGMPYAIWQHDMKGKMAGIEGAVDLNVAAE